MHRIRGIVSVVLMVLIGWITVFQCHHHDVCGHAFFASFSDAEVALSEHHSLGCHDCTTETVSHEGHQCNHSGSTECGMHLADALCDHNYDNEFSDSGLSVFVPIDITGLSEPEETELSDKEQNEDYCLTAGCRRVSKLRGPPRA